MEDETPKKKPRKGSKRKSKREAEMVQDGQKFLSRIGAMKAGMPVKTPSPRPVGRRKSFERATGQLKSPQAKGRGRGKATPSPAAQKTKSKAKRKRSTGDEAINTKRAKRDASEEEEEDREDEEEEDGEKESQEEEEVKQEEEELKPVKSPRRGRGRPRKNQPAVTPPKTKRVARRTKKGAKPPPQDEEIDKGDDIDGDEVENGDQESDKPRTPKRVAKRKRSGGARGTPSKKKTKPEQNESEEMKADSEAEEKESEEEQESEESEEDEELGEYKMVSLIRCHSIDDDPDDDHTRIYACAFHPSEDHVIATVGGNSVCLTDLAAGKVLKKYTHYKELGEEEFCCLAWTKLIRNTIPVLAVAGKQKDIKVIDVNQKMVYAILQGHTAPVCSLSFSPTRPSWLLSGAESPGILLWDVPPPGQGRQPPDVKCLARFMGSERQIFELAFCPVMGNQFVAAGQRKLRGKSKDPESYEGGVIATWHLEDDLQEKLNDASESGERLEVDIEDAGLEEEVDLHVESVGWVSEECIASKQVYDDKVVLVTPDTHRDVAVLLHDKGESIAWFMKMCLSADRSKLLIGTDTGKVEVFAVRQFAHVKGSSRRAVPRVKPEYVLQDQHDKRTIYSIAISRDNKYIVCGTDQNLVVVWERI